MLLNVSMEVFAFEQVEEELPVTVPKEKEEMSIVPTTDPTWTMDPTQTTTWE